MTICGNCHKEASRTRIIWDKNGVQREECKSCAPENFDKHTDPSDKKIWMGYEAHPNEYVRAQDGGFDRKQEYRAEQEARLRNETEDEKAARLRAEAKKRSERRTSPMDEAEFAAAMNKAAEIAAWIVGSAARGVDVN